MHMKCTVSHHNTVMTSMPTAGQLFVNASAMEWEFKMSDGNSVYASANKEESTEEHDSVMHEDSYADSPVSSTDDLDDSVAADASVPRPVSEESP